MQIQSTIGKCVAILSLCAIPMMGQSSQNAQQPQQTAQMAAPQSNAAPQAGTQQVQAKDIDRPPSASLNEALPRWISFSGEIRLRGEGFSGAGFKPDDSDGYLLTRLRLNMRLQPTSWMRFYFQGQDAHILGEDQAKIAALPPYHDDFDLRQAYVEFGDVENKTFGFRVGRQELAFGSERLLGNANWLNVPRSFDGFRATYRGNGFRLDGFAACMDRTIDNQFNECVSGSNIYGGYSTFTKLIPKTSIEPFLFWRRQSGLKAETGGIGVMNEATIGIHWNVKPSTGIDYDVEMARQAGSLGTDTISAWAGHWLAGYTFSQSRYKPRAFAEFDYASGDQNATDGTRGTFDQIYPSGHDLYALTDQIGFRNIQVLRGGFEFKPAAKWKLTTKYGDYWLANIHDALYNGPGTAVAKSAAGTAGRFVGQEIDFIAAYNFNKRTSVGAGLGHLFAGTFLNNTTPGNGYTYPYLQLTYAF
jgi:hypothetical protein